MKILVTGSDGFTGRYFVEQARAAGHEIHPLKANLERDSDVLEEVYASAPDVVVHLAGVSYVGHHNNGDFYRTNLLGTMHLLSALNTLENPPSKVLLASSANVYGNSTRSPINEEEPPRPVNHYASSKLAMENMALTYASDLPIIITRPFNYTGVGQGANFLIPKLVDHFAKRRDVIELGNLNISREFNDVRMVVSAYLGLIKAGVPGSIYNICTGVSHTLNSVVERLQVKTGHKIEIKVNKDLIRTNEVQNLFGAPEKLINTIPDLHAVDLDQTLSWMLDNASTSI